MNPQWRTATVLALCRRMLDAREYDALPILADALQDAGCDDPQLLGPCQTPDLEPVLAERVVNLVYSDETAAAVRWLEQFVRDINYNDTEPHDYYYAIHVGHEGAEGGQMSFGTDAGADFFREGEGNLREFFRNWSLVTGIPVADETLGRIGVRCAC